MPRDLEDLERPGLSPRLAVVALIVVILLAAASIWWLTGPSHQLTKTQFTPSDTANTVPPRPIVPGQNR